MIKTEDIIKLPVNDESLKSGLEYALLSWTSHFNRMGKASPYDRIEKILFGVAAEKEFIRFLQENKIDFDVSGRTRWYEIDRYDVGIRNTPIDVKSNFLDLLSKHIQDKYGNIFHSKEEWFLTCHALVPLDQFNGPANQRITKNYVFPFVEGYFAENARIAPLVHAFWDYRWLKKSDYKNDKSTGKLKIKYSCPCKKASIRVYGTKAPRTACIEEIQLDKKLVISENHFHQVFSIQWTGQDLPSGDLVIQKEGSRLSEKIANSCGFEITTVNGNKVPLINDWQSLKMYDYSVYLLGWIKERDFRVCGSKYKRFCHEIEQYSETKVDNWGCLVEELSPMSTIGKMK